MIERDRAGFAFDHRVVDARSAAAEQAQEAADIVVLGIAPELPILVGGQLFGVEPYGTTNALAHLDAGRGRDQRRRQTKEGTPVGSAPELDSADDVTPLVGAANLQL